MGTGSADLTKETILLVDDENHIDDGAMLCSVTDNGPGILAEELDRALERFYQVDKSRSRREGGAGLGLPITQRIAQGHGGRIRAESAEGLGTRITVELPLRSSE